jgi:pseudaminic acid biosynthesis-associated methylase
MAHAMSELWCGEFGNQYTARNTRATLQARKDMWACMLPAGCDSILEVGANVGLNLEALSYLTGAELYACEPNDVARAELGLLLDADHIRSDYADKLGWPDRHADLTFTSGVLIHVPPDKIELSIKEINRVSARYVICGEYFAPSEEMIPYRGHDNAMWRRDYGSMFMDLCPDLHPLGTLFAWKRTTGLDNLTFWIFEKGPMRH